MTAPTDNAALRAALEEIVRLRAVLVRICEEDRHGRMIKANPEGGFRGRGGMIASFALTGKNGSHLIDEDIRKHVAALAAAIPPEQPKTLGWDEDGMCDDHGKFACSKCAIPPEQDGYAEGRAREVREFCPEPKDTRCCQQPIHVGGPGFNVYRCKHCGSESYT